MPRKSVASLAVISTALPQRPAPPTDLTPAQARIWASIVTEMPVDFFIAGSLPLLACYVRHVDAASVIARLIHETNPERDLARYSKLSEMAARETKAICSLSTKLRLAPSNRFDSKKRIPVTVSPRPWEQR
jgi:hypothetical protein